jgi:hypothetical protein
MKRLFIELAWVAATVFCIAGTAFALDKKTYHSYDEFYGDVFGPTVKIQALKQGFDPIFIEGGGSTVLQAGAWRESHRILHR